MKKDLEDFFNVLSITIGLPSISNSNTTFPSFFPFLSKDCPLWLGCNPNKANSIANKMLVFPLPISPDKRIEPSGKIIS